MLCETKGQGKSRRLFFFYRKEAKIINWEQDILYTTEQYQQLREYKVC
jgi:hypothetical protein